MSVTRINANRESGNFRSRFPTTAYCQKENEKTKGSVYFVVKCDNMRIGAKVE